MNECWNGFRFVYQLTRILGYVIKVALKAILLHVEALAVQ